MSLIFSLLISLACIEPTICIDRDLVVMFVEVSDNKVLLYCKGDEEFFLYTYNPLERTGKEESISSETYFAKRRIKEGIDHVYNFDYLPELISNKFDVEINSLTIVEYTKIEDTNIFLISYDDGHSILNTYYVLSDSENLFIRRFDSRSELHNVICVNKSLIMINNCYPGFSISQVDY